MLLAKWIDKAAGKPTARVVGGWFRKTVQVRDGNHRVFGSIAGGERTVWVLMMVNQWNDLVDNKYSTRGHRLLRKALNIRPKRRRRRQR